MWPDPKESRILQKIHQKFLGEKFDRLTKRETEIFALLSEIFACQLMMKAKYAREINESIYILC